MTRSSLGRTASSRAGLGDTNTDGDWRGNLDGFCPYAHLFANGAVDGFFLPTFRRWIAGVSGAEVGTRL